MLNTKRPLISDPSSIYKVLEGDVPLMLVSAAQSGDDGHRSRRPLGRGRLSSSGGLGG